MLYRRETQKISADIAGRHDDKRDGKLKRVTTADIMTSVLANRLTMTAMARFIVIT